MGAAAGGVGAVLSGNDPLKAALIAGISAGIMNVSGANQAISGTLNSILGPAATQAANEAVNQAAAEVTEQILVNGASQAVQAAASAAGNTLLSEGIRAGLGGTAGSQPPPTQPPAEEPPVSIFTGARPEAVAGADVVTGIGGGAAADAVAGDERADTIQEEEPPVATVTGARPEAVTGADVVTGIGSGAAVDVMTPPPPAPAPVEEPPAAPPAPPPVEEPPVAIVTGARPEAVVGADAVTGIGSGIAADVVAAQPTPPPPAPPPVEELPPAPPPVEEPPVATVIGARPEAVAVADAVTAYTYKTRGDHTAGKTEYLLQQTLNKAISTTVQDMEKYIQQKLSNVGKA
jgi:hypothetical protein